MGIGTAALIGALALLVWGMVSLGSEPKKKKGKKYQSKHPYDDDGFWDDFLDWDD